MAKKYIFIITILYTFLALILLYVNNKFNFVFQNIELEKSNEKLLKLHHDFKNFSNSVHLFNYDIAINLINFYSNDYLVIESFKNDSWIYFNENINYDLDNFISKIHFINNNLNSYDVTFLKIFDSYFEKLNDIDNIVKDSSDFMVTHLAIFADSVKSISDNNFNLPVGSDNHLSDVIRQKNENFFKPLVKNVEVILNSFDYIINSKKIKTNITNAHIENYNNSFSKFEKKFNNDFNIYIDNLKKSYPSYYDTFILKKSFSLTNDVLCLNKPMTYRF